MEIKVSVLVAVYNAEAYLRKCLESLVGQTLREIQVLCVDDASTDGSWDILKEYAARDSRIEIIHLPKNQGQAHARNVALQQVAGKYVCFLDSDDWLAPDSLQKIVDKFGEDEETDAVLFRCIFVYPASLSRSGETQTAGQREEEYPMPHFGRMEGSEAFVASLTWKIHGVYAVKISIHQAFPYDESSHSFSDDNTTRIHYLRSRKVAESQAFYYYLQHAGSVSHQQSLRRFDYLQANLSMKRQLVELHADDPILSEYENERWLNVVGLYLLARKMKPLLSASDYDEAVRKVKAAWQTIETARLKTSNHYKLGYLAFLRPWIPRPLGWTLFRIQATTYYVLRKICGNLPS